jgi:hypothetical protein
VAKLFSRVGHSPCTKNFVKLERAIHGDWIKLTIAKYKISIAFAINLADYLLRIFFRLSVDLYNIWWQPQLCDKRDAFDHADGEADSSGSNDTCAPIFQLDCLIACFGQPA